MAGPIGTLKVRGDAAISATVEGWIRLSVSDGYVNSRRTRMRCTLCLWTWAMSW